MDRVGNRRHGVPLPYQYFSLSEWHEVFARLDLHVEHWHARLGLYPRPLSWVFERSLHFVTLLEARA